MPNIINFDTFQKFYTYNNDIIFTPSQSSRPTSVSCSESPSPDDFLFFSSPMGGSSILLLIIPVLLTLIMHRRFRRRVSKTLQEEHGDQGDQSDHAGHGPRTHLFKICIISIYLFCISLQNFPLIDKKWKKVDKK